MNSLRSRLVLCYTLMVTLTLTVTAVSGYFLVRRQLLNGTDFLLEAEFKEIEARVLNLAPPFTREQIEKAIGNHAAIDAPFYFFQVHEEGGTVLFRSANLTTTELPDLTPANLQRDSLILGDLGLVRVCEFHAGPLHVQIASSLNYLNTLSTRFYRVLLVAVPAVLLFSLGVGYFLCEITLRPLRSIEQTARRISLSNLKERIPMPRGKDEIARLAELLNEMFDRLEKSFEQVKQFTADFSHELRTPLSMVALNAEKVLKKSGLDRESAAALEEVLLETQRLNQIIDQLLTLAKAEAQTLPLEIAPRSTSQFMQDFAEDASALADASGKQFKLVQNDELTAAFDSSWIRQVLFNLLSNAIKFSPAGGQIELASTRENGSWRFTLRDEGPGIPPAEAENVFERFRQLRKSPADLHGAGLGLAVSKSIVELHKGSIRCEMPEDGRGTMMKVQLPLSGS